MTYSVLFVTTITPGEVFYADTSAQAKADSDYLVLFRTQQPGFISQSTEVVSETTRNYTLTYDTKENFDAYDAAMRATPEFQRRKAYFDSIEYTLEEDVLVTGATPT
jgi:hypothetical protein